MDHIRKTGKEIGYASDDKDRKEQHDPDLRPPQILHRGQNGDTAEEEKPQGHDDRACHREAVKKKEPDIPENTAFEKLDQRHQDCQQFADPLDSFPFDFLFVVAH